MDFTLTVIISLIYVIPLIIAIIYFSRIVYKSLSVFLVQLLLADIAILFWGIAGIPVLLPQNIFTNTELIHIEELGVIIGSFGFIFVSFIFNTPHFGNKHLILSRIGIVAFGLLAGIKVALLLMNNTSESIYGLYLSNGVLHRYTNPFIQVLVLIAFILLIAVLLLYSQWQNKFPEYLISKDTKKKSFYATLLMGIGVSINYLGLFVPVIEHAHLLFLISRFFITFSFILITLMIGQNPIITLKEKGSPYYMVANGVVGWVLAINTDLGPSPEAYSEQTAQLYSLNAKDLILFAVSSISIVGIGQNFTDTQFIIPYPSREEELSVLCFSFSMPDPLVKDQRKTEASIVFGIIIPKIFLNYLGNIGQESFTMAKKIEKFHTIQELKENIDFDKETFLIVRNLLVKNIT